MLFWLMFILLTIGIGLVVFANYYATCEYGDSNKFKRWCWKNDYEIKLTGIGVAVISGIILIVMIIGLIYTYAEAPGMVAANEARYEALTYKMESTTCRDEFGFLSKDIIDEVQSWNEELSRGKTNQRDFWIGIFVPNVYDQFEFIDYNTYKLPTD